MHPAEAGHLELGRQIEHRAGELIPGEVRLVSREQQELLTERVGREGEFQARGPELGEVVLIEGDHRPTGAVVEQHIVVEDGDRLRGGRLAEVLDESGDGVARIGETGQQQHKGKPARHRRRVRDTFVDVSGEGHVSMLRAAADGGAERVMLTANTPSTTAADHAPRMEA